MPADADSTKKQIEDRLAELPEDVRNAVLSADLGARLREIGTKHNLHVDQMGKLEDETMLVMLGFFEPESFHTQLQEQLSLQPQEAAGLAQEISAAVFTPIRDSLKRFTQGKKAPSPAQQPSDSALASQPGSASGLSTVPVAPAFPPPMPAAEKMLAQPTAVTVPTPAPTPAPAAPAEKPSAATQPPKPYKEDPYREPIE